MGYMKKGKEKNKALLGYSGFSLVELMIVVAIIGIVTAIAIPNFQSMQARARQSEAKSALGGIYTAAQTFHSKWEVYAGALPVIGYTPNGDYRYLVGFHEDENKFCGTKTITDSGNDDLECGPAPQRIFTPTPTTAEISCAHVNETCPDGSDYKGLAAIDGTTHFDGSAVAGGGSITDQKVTTEVSVNTFLAAAIGDPLGLGTITTALDLWAIDERKTLQHKTKGDYDEL